MSNNNLYSYPSSLKKLRACTECRLVKTEEQVIYYFIKFEKDGCDNCEDQKNYTTNFKGIIAIMNPRGSWAAKWLHHSKISNKYS